MPDDVGADAASADQAIDRLGLPLVVKRRVGTAGAQVRIAATADEVERALAEVGDADDRSTVFFEQFIEGDVVHYAAVVGVDGPVHDYVVAIHKSPTNPLGPSTAVVVIDEPELVMAGRRIAEVMGATGFVALEFVRDDEGACWHIDASTRVWGNVLSLLDVGSNLFEAYRYQLGLRADRPVFAPVAFGLVHPVQPSAMKRAIRAGDRHDLASSVASFVRYYLPVVGGRYVLVTALELGSIWRGHRRESRRPSTG